MMFMYFPFLVWPHAYMDCRFAPSYNVYVFVTQTSKIAVLMCGCVVKDIFRY